MVWGVFDSFGSFWVVFRVRLSVLSVFQWLVGVFKCFLVSGVV